MTLTAPAPSESLIGVQAPRIAPPEPAKHKLDEFSAMASQAGISLVPWQENAARYLTAIGPHGGWSFREVAIIVARRNGKTELLVPRILMDLRAGKRIIHTAQNRTLPREVFMRIIEFLDPSELKRKPREANGQEKVEMKNGGSYKIVAPQRGARGLGADTLIFDELREFEDYDIIGAARPTLAASPDPQTIYLSNAGSDASIVLNDLKRRGEEAGQHRLAYLEWSASPDRPVDDRVGWAEANPALGRFLDIETLEDMYNSLPSAEFETEHLCRWVASMQPRLVSERAWQLCRATIDEKPVRPAIGFNMDPSGRRASAVMAWQMNDGRIACVELREATGDPIDLPSLGADLKDLASQHGAKRVSYASWTDKDLARYVPRAEALDGKEYANASEHFARLILSGRLAWDGATHITDDLNWTARKPHESGAWQAVPSTPERSVTAVLAAIRACWLASAPRQVPRIG